MKTSIKIRSVLIVLVLYGFAIGNIISIPSELIIALFVYVILAIIISYGVYKKEIKVVESDKYKFKKNFPFRPYGIPVAEFQHVFSFQESIIKPLFDKIKNEVSRKTPLPSLEGIEITDTDKDLISPDVREFYVSTGETTLRGSTITLVIHFTNYGQVQSIKWWLLMVGYIDLDKLFFYLSFSPITLPFWIIPHLRREHDLLGRVRNISPTFYNDMDVSTEILCVHDTVLDSLIDLLDSYEIDTSDLKAKRAQIMNINISGGKTTIGTIIQGAFNKIRPQQQRGK